MERVISISLAAFDGYDLGTAFEEIARLDVSTVELAFIEDYTDPFSEECFSSQNAKAITRMLKDLGLTCFAVSAHLNLSRTGVLPIFQRRMDFAACLSSQIIITNSAPRDKREIFLRTIGPLLRHAESIGLKIGLENPGDGKASLVNSAREGADLIREIGSEYVKLNYDFGNVLSHLQGKIRPEIDFAEGLWAIAHLHIKDVKFSEAGWNFTAIGDGDIDYKKIFKRLKQWPVLCPMSLEIPLRMSRTTSASPRRMREAVPLSSIRATLEQSLRFIRASLE